MTFDKKRVIIVILEVLSIIIVFFVPYGYHIDLGPGPNMIMAILWDFSENVGFHFLEALEYFPLYLFRIVVLYEILRYFQEKISRKKLIIMGIINELIPLIISIPGSLILNSEGENFLPIMINFPVLLLFVTFIVILFPHINENRN